MELDKDKKKLLIYGLIGVALVIAVLIITLFVIQYINGQKQNIIIDGVSRKYSDNLIFIDDVGNPYVCVETLTPLLGQYKNGGYNFYNGERGKGTEDRTKCYVENPFEVATISMNSNKIYKALLTDTTMYDTYTITNNVRRINDKLYISLEGMQIMFNVKYSYDNEKQNLYINTLPYLANKAATTAKSLGYTNMSEDFSNRKALVNNMIVIQQNQNAYGVIDFQGNQLIGPKYQKIQYAESGREFIATSAGKVGVLTNDGYTKIPINYEELKIIDNEIGLYLVKLNSKYGILDKNGNILIYLDFDKIGIENMDLFPNDDIKNPYILYDNCIPVCQNGKWGMYDITGKLLADIQYSGFGCISSTQRESASQNVLLIPSSEGLEGIVVSKENYANQKRYGILNTNGKAVTSIGFNRVYAETSSGTANYYMEFGSTIYTVKDRLSLNNSEVNGGGGTVQITGSTSGAEPNENTIPIDENNNGVISIGGGDSSGNDVVTIQ